MRRPVPERRIRSLKELKRIIRTLDLDEGVRVLGRLNDRRGVGFIFVTTSHTAAEPSQKYCVNTTERIYDEEAKTHLPGGKEEFRYFSEPEDVVEFIERNAARPLRVWYY